MSALLTGCFCGIFALGIHWATNMLGQLSILMISFTSGFLGSLFASLVMTRMRGEGE
ncbi:MAG: hypothetical protein HKN27_07980 [Silicimonas sp.]|nr:hypothetical protein [Silicimonas sp.]